MEQRKLAKSCDTLARLNKNEHKLFENQNHCIKPLPITFNEEDAEIINNKDSINDSTKLNHCNNSSKPLLCIKDSQVISCNSMYITINYLYCCNNIAHVLFLELSGKRTTLTNHSTMG